MYSTGWSAQYRVEYTVQGGVYSTGVEYTVQGGVYSTGWSIQYIQYIRISPSTQKNLE